MPHQRYPPPAKARAETLLVEVETVQAPGILCSIPNDTASVGHSFQDADCSKEADHVNCNDRHPYQPWRMSRNRRQGELEKYRQSARSRSRYWQFNDTHIAQMQDLVGSRSVSTKDKGRKTWTSFLNLAHMLDISYSDPRMASDLVKRVQGKPEGRKLEIIVNDVMKTELPPVDVCISNTPYQVWIVLISGLQPNVNSSAY